MDAETEIHSSVQTHPPAMYARQGFSTLFSIFVTFLVILEQFDINSSVIEGIIALKMLLFFLSKWVRCEVKYQKSLSLISVYDHTLRLTPYPVLKYKTWKLDDKKPINTLLSTTSIVWIFNCNFSVMCLWPPPPQFLDNQKLLIYRKFWCHPLKLHKVGNLNPNYQDSKTCMNRPKMPPHSLYGRELIESMICILPSLKALQ